MNLNEAVGVLEAWDNTVSATSEGSVLFINFWNGYRPRADLIYEVDFNERQPASTPHGLGDAEAALKALGRAIRKTRDDHGSLDVAWGEVHRLHRGDVNVPIGGSSGDEHGAFRVIIYRRDRDGKLIASGGDSFVFAAEFGPQVRAHSILVYSQSGNPDSAHYNDQSALFAKGEW